MDLGVKQTSTSPKKAAKGSSRVPINDFESSVIDEITQDRLRQSRVIAQQMETIGKLHRALSQFSDRDYRRTSFSGHDTFNMTDSFVSDDVLPVTHDQEVQTDLTIPESVNLGSIIADHKKLQSQAVASERALQSERAKAHRVLQACARVARTGSVSSPALAKWISLGLDEFSQIDRSRVMSTDDGILGIPVRRALAFSTAQSSVTVSPASSQIRTTLSEGHSPTGGLDLDIIYGNFHPNDSHAVLEETFTLSPRGGDRAEVSVNRFAMSPPPDAQILAGDWWTGFCLVHLDIPNTVAKGRYGLHGIELSLEENIVHAKIGAGLSMDGIFDFEGKKIIWGNGQVWVKERASYG